MEKSFYMKRVSIFEIVQDERCGSRVKGSVTDRKIEEIITLIRDLKLT